MRRQVVLWVLSQPLCHHQTTMRIYWSTTFKRIIDVFTTLGNIHSQRRISKDNVTPSVSDNNKYSVFSIVGHRKAFIKEYVNYQHGQASILSNVLRVLLPKIGSTYYLCGDTDEI